ncbi:MAG TPA: N-acetyltransferase [Candidatus Sulfotelmatobacter sp.]|nr:N-acetyltransferase [Candidatus Sulfotelmatobacter sp.]
MATVPILRTYTPDDFEAIYEIDHACYQPAIAYSRREMRNYLRFPGGDCVLAEVVEDPAPDAFRQGTASAVPTVAPSSGVLTPEVPRAAQVNNAGAPPKKIVGFCITAHQRARGYIITIDVLEKYRRQRVGTALLAEAERRLASHGVKEVGLETETTNESAIAFWHRHGYRTRGVWQGYYPGGRDAFSMTKTLAQSDAAAKARA